MTIGQLARATAVKTSTIRFYERLGLLPRAARTASGYRVFSEQAVRRVRVVQAAKQFGFSLRDIGTFLRTRDDGGKPCEQVREAARELLQTIDGDIAVLRARRRSVRTTLRRWDEMLVATPSDRQARLLESLPDRQSLTYADRFASNFFLHPDAQK